MPARLETVGVQPKYNVELRSQVVAAEEFTFEGQNEGLLRV